MNTLNQSVLDRDIAYDRVEKSYPCVEVYEPSDALALVLLGLPKGDLSVICFVNNAMREIRKVARSARTLDALRRVSKTVYHKSPTDSTEIKSGIDAVEVFVDGRNNSYNPRDGFSLETGTEASCIG